MQSINSPQFFKLIAAIAITFIVLVVIAFPQPANALCTQPQEGGIWQNTDSQTRGITQIEIKFVCQDQILNGEPYPPDPPFYMHVYGKCSPSDCDWGEVGARELRSGHVYAEYDQGFAKRYVYAKMSQYRPGNLWLYIRNDFSDPGRDDYTSQDWFQRQ